MKGLMVIRNLHCREHADVPWNMGSFTQMPDNQGQAANAEELKGMIDLVLAIPTQRML